MKACKQMENKLIEYLYGEADTQVRQEVEAHLQTCASCRHTLDELQATREILKKSSVAAAPIPMPHRQDFPVKKKRLPILQFLKYGAAAAILLLFLTRFSLEYSNGNLSIHFGPAHSQNANLYVSQEELSRQNEAQLALINQLLEKQNQLQDARLANYLNQYTITMQAQREKDIATMFTTVNALYSQTRQGLEQTNEAVLGLYQYAGQLLRAE
jgi:hypothetical protein